MTSRDFQSLLPRWLKEQSLPLWTGVGVDTTTGTVWEALDHAGTPCASMPRRLRVQVRQAYCFTQSDDPAHWILAEQLFRFAMDQGFDSVSGNLAGQLAPDMSILTAKHELYDIAFMLLAASALISRGADILGDLTRLEIELAKLKAPRGWYENATYDLPRRQNPHMHMFETATALFAATGEARFRDMAEECLGLFRDVFLSCDGRVLEYFSEDWAPLTGKAQAVEPGHMAEWVYLIDRYEAATGRLSGVPLTILYRAVLCRRDETGLLPDRSDPQTHTRRLWPQTELLKATVAMHRRGETPSEAPYPEDILAQMWEQYFDTPVPGGWYDKRSTASALLSDHMPASTFYHIIVAFHFYLLGSA